MKLRWNLNGLELGALALYACASPVGMFLESQWHVSNAFLLALLNLPFLALLGALMMVLEPLHPEKPVGLGFMWAIVLVQSYVAFVFLRQREESKGIGTWRTLGSSFGYLMVVALTTLVLGGFVLVLSLRV